VPAAALAPLHLHLTVASRPFDDAIAAGTIIRQQPVSGRLQEGSTVSVDVSAGPPPVTVPNLSGLTEDQATQRLVGAGLVKGQVSHMVDATIGRGLLIDWTGRGGQLARQAPVNLVISDGPPTVAIPDLHSQSLAAAQAALQALQLTAVQLAKFSDTVPKGQVIDTVPPAATSVPLGTQVTVEVSKGQDLVAVPDVRTQSVLTATKNLEAVGFTVSEVVGSPDRPVYVTNPPTGALVKRGSAIKLYTS
jgi:serine/threonine-protein kinase